MALITLDAVTLRSRLYSESSRIVTFFSREQGLVAGIAKGVRGPRSGFGTALEPLQRVRVTLSVRPNRDLQTVTGADLVQPWSRIREDLFASTYAQGVVELLARTFWRDHPGEDLFDLLVTILEALDDGGADPQLLFLCFGVQLAAALGYAVRLERCAGCGGELGPRVTFAVADGSVWCSGCYPPEGSIVRAGRETIRLLARLGSADGPAAAASLTPAGPVRREAERLVRKHLEYHTETDLDLRSLRLAESLRHRRFTGPQGREPEGEPRSPSRS